MTAVGANIGYLDQTYIDPTTGFRVTIVNPADHVAYGVLTIPMSYNFEPGDTLVFQVVSNGARFVGSSVPPAQAEQPSRDLRSHDRGYHDSRFHRWRHAYYQHGSRLWQ